MKNIYIIILLYSIIIAKSDAQTLHCDTLNQHILRFYFDDNTAEPILQFDFRKPICTVANAKIEKAKMTMGKEPVLWA